MTSEAIPEISRLSYATSRIWKCKTLDDGKAIGRTGDLGGESGKFLLLTLIRK